MPVITFYSSCKQETGNTLSAITFATYLGITRNKSTLLITTGLNDTTAKDSLWPAQEKRKSGLFGPNTSALSQNGIEELDRIIRSNRITPDIITNYTRVALKGRLELLMSYNGDEKQFRVIEQDYIQVLAQAGKAYDTVIVDLDKGISSEVKKSILQVSDIVIATTNQNLNNIENLAREIETSSVLSKDKTLITLGKYDEKSRYNAKNISRNLLRQKEIINTIPYNSVLLEASQEGKMIDVIWSMLNMKNKDENTGLLIDELNRLNEKIDITWKNLQMKR